MKYNQFYIETARKNENYKYLLSWTNQLSDSRQLTGKYKIPINIIPEYFLDIVHNILQNMVLGDVLNIYRFVISIYEVYRFTERRL